MAGVKQIGAMPVRTAAYRLGVSPARVYQMIEEGKEWLDVIAQISAVREAVAMLGVELLKNDVACKWKGKRNIDEAYLKSLFRMK